MQCNQNLQNIFNNLFNMTLNEGLYFIKMSS